MSIRRPHCASNTSKTINNSWSRRIETGRRRTSKMLMMSLSSSWLRVIWRRSSTFHSRWVPMEGTLRARCSPLNCTTRTMTMARSWTGRHLATMLRILSCTIQGLLVLFRTATRASDLYHQDTLSRQSQRETWFHCQPVILEITSLPRMASTVLKVPNKAKVVTISVR